MYGELKSIFIRRGGCFAFERRREHTVETFEHQQLTAISTHCKKMILNELLFAQYLFVLLTDNRTENLVSNWIYIFRKIAESNCCTQGYGLF